MKEKIFLISIFLITLCFLFFYFEEIEAGEEIRIDKTPPNVSVVGAPADWQNTNATATVFCTDPGAQPSGCDPATYRLAVYSSNPGACSTNYADYPTIPPQTISSHSWVCAAARDNAGNIGFSPSPVEFKVDQIAPTVSVIGAPATWQNTDATATVSCTDAGGSDCDPATYRLKVYSSNPGACPADYAEYTLISPQTISSHSWVCGAAKDVATNVGFSTPVEFRVDKEGPTSDIVSPALSSWQTSPSFNVSVIDSDTGGSGLANCFKRVCDSVFGCTPWAARTCGTFFAVTVGPGAECQTEGLNTCIVYVYATDNAGNTPGGSWRTFSIDLSVPFTSIYCNGELDCPAPSYSPPVTVTLSCSDTYSGCTTTHYCVDQANTCNPTACP